MREVFAQLSGEVEHLDNQSMVVIPTAVIAEINPHVMVTKARYSRGAGTVFMTKFEGTCIWAEDQDRWQSQGLEEGRTKIYPAKRTDNEVAYCVSLRCRSSWRPLRRAMAKLLRYDGVSAALRGDGRSCLVYNTDVLCTK